MKKIIDEVFDNIENAHKEHNFGDYTYEITKTDLANALIKVLEGLPRVKYYNEDARQIHEEDVDEAIELIRKKLNQ